MALSACLLCSSCGTSTGDGAYAGSMLGTILGSAIGGIVGGPHGSDVGTIVGMAGGAAVGAAVGSQADKERQEAAVRRQEQQQRDYSYNDRHYSSDDNGAYTRSGADDSGFDPTNSGDDTLYDFGSDDYTGSYSAAQPEKVVPTVRYDGIKAVSPSATGLIEIRNPRFVDDNQDGRLNAGEFSKVIFEVYNTSKEALTDVQPTVIETTGNRQIAISQSIHVERIAPGRGIRYTAMVRAGHKIKDGTATFRVYAAQGSGHVVSNVCEFNVPTARR